MEIKYFIRTTNERQLDSSYSQIDYELLVDSEHKPLKSLIEQYNYISQYDAVLLEDDLILCKDFKEKIETVINEHPNEIINFFYEPMQYFNSRVIANFSYSQCRYYPKGITNQIAEKLSDYSLYNTKSTALYVTICANKCKFKIFQYRPCLVQHIDSKSLLFEKISFCRRSPYFIDYLDELGITYEEAKSNENRDKLINLMNEKFKGVDNR